MSHPFLKSIHPVNLLSFGPKTEPIELRPLNILIGPNGCGKSNLIEVIRLLHYLPDKDPWTVVLRTGGVDEWICKGEKGLFLHSSVSARVSLESLPDRTSDGEYRVVDYSIALAKVHSSFYVTGESVKRGGVEDWDANLYSSFQSGGSFGELNLRDALSRHSPPVIALNPERSVLSQLTSRGIQDAQVGTFLHELFEVAEVFEELDFHQDWEFGADLVPRDSVTVGEPVGRLEEDARNLAQMLAHFKDNHRPVFEKVEELMRRFYEPLKSIEVRIYGTSLQVGIIENSGISVSAFRLSDGTLRWLALVMILLNPTPAPVTCIEEPELGLHPDIIPTLGDLLRDASTRTQLILTTHSRTLVECFTETPEVICVCEKEEGSTVIRRLKEDDLKEWLQEYANGDMDYSLGNLWSRGHIGGNRW